MYISIIKKIFFDSRCFICNGKIINKSLNYICDKCLKYFDEVRGNSCKICGHPLNEYSKCNSCSKIGKIYYDSYSFIQYYTGFYKNILGMLKINNTYIINKIFLDILLSKGIIKNDGLITVIPDNFIKKIKKGRAGLNYLLELLKNKKFKVKYGIIKKYFKINNSQKLKNDFTRLKEIEKSFYLPIKNKNKFSDKVYLIDDIYTTGSTLNYGARLLKEAGFNEVHIVSFFRAVMNY